MISEFGWQSFPDGTTNNGLGLVPESVQAAYILETMLSAYKLGVVAFCVNELLDVLPGFTAEDVGQTYGLFNSQGTQKVSATALRNLMTNLADNSPSATSFSAGKLNYTVTNKPGTYGGFVNTGYQEVLFQVSFGTYWLIMWNEQALNTLGGNNVPISIPVECHTDVQRDGEVECVGGRSFERRFAGDWNECLIDLHSVAGASHYREGDLLMPFTTYADGTVVFAAQLNADNTTSLDLNTTSPQTIKSVCSFPGLSTTTLVATGLVTLSNALVDNTKAITSGASYAVLATDRYVFCQTGGTITIGLPAGPSTGRVITVKDGLGTASTGVITITPSTGLIDGQATYVINANWGTVTLIYNGVRWLSVQ